MRAVEPILVVELFPQERKHLLELFSDLTEADWQKPTVCPGWTVKDIGLHLLGDDLGYLSGKRDDFSNPFFTNKEMQQWNSLVKNINEANELWVKATRRISPRLLTDLLALTGAQFYAYIQSLDQMAINGAVSWIRDAVNKPGLTDRKFLHPVLDAFVRALPHTYRDVPVANTTVIKLLVTGEAGDTWYLLGEANHWSLYKEGEWPPTTIVTMDQETCWRRFTRGMRKEQARAHTTIEGDEKLGEKMLDTVSIIA